MSIQDKLAVEKQGFYFFDNKPMVVWGWNADMELHTENLKSLPLWIRLRDLNLKYWGMASLSKIGCLIGIPIKTDQFIKQKSMIKYARLLIEVPMEEPFPEYVDFFNENGELIRQQVNFEWVLTKCAHSSMFGHTAEVCKKKKNIRTEWRRVQQK